MKYSVEFANAPGPVPLFSLVYATGWPSTYGVIWVAAGARCRARTRSGATRRRMGRAKKTLLRVAPSPIADAERAAVLRRVRVDEEAAGVLVEVRCELHREAVVVGVGVPLEPELDRQRRAPTG